MDKSILETQTQSTNDKKSILVETESSNKCSETKQKQTVVTTMVKTLSLNKSIKQKLNSCILTPNEQVYKKVYILYLSGCAGANEFMEISRGHLLQHLINNKYLCDFKATQENNQYIVSPQQENNIRIKYIVEQFDKISPSINVSLQDIKRIATRLGEQYDKYDAFIVLCGFDLICYIATLVSFMLEDLAKLVIFTGGFLPISYMRNDTVNNIIECFSIISLAENFNDVIIVCKNKGYRANRSIKSKEGEFDTIRSPNMEPLVSVNIKLRFRSHLFLPFPQTQFNVFTDISDRVSILKFHILQNLKNLAYELSNPNVDGFVIESYGASNLPQFQPMLLLFKQAHEKQSKIFVNVSQTIYKANQSMMKNYLEKYHIIFGGDMTAEAALAKLAYVLGKKMSLKDTQTMLVHDLRGELTEERDDHQFERYTHGFIELVDKSLRNYYPLGSHKNFMQDLEDKIANEVFHNYTSEQFCQLYQHEGASEETKKDFLVLLANRNDLLAKAVQAKNTQLVHFLISIGVNINKEDEHECSPLYYALKQQDKLTIKEMTRMHGIVICPLDFLLELLISHLINDDANFYLLLYHMQFKDTLHQIVNSQGKNLAHIAAFLGARECLQLLQNKFNLNFNLKDIYGKTVAYYLSNYKK